MSISAVILSFNAANDLDRCVRSLIEVERFIPGRDQILIIDNGSSDGSREVIERLVAAYPNLVDATLLTANFGTTMPRNIGFAKASGDHILVIDSDIHFQTPVLPALLQQLAADRSIGIITPSLIFPDGRPQMSTDVFPTVSRKLERLFRLRSLEHQVEHDYRPSRSVDYAISAFWLMRSDLIDLVGLLDERIFYAPEDVDFCLRVWLSGHRVIHRQDLAVVHDAKERSRSLKGALFAWRHILGLAYFFKKHGYAFDRNDLYRRIGRLRSKDTPLALVATQKLEGEAGG